MKNLGSKTIETDRLVLKAQTMDEQKENVNVTENETTEIIQTESSTEAEQDDATSGDASTSTRRQAGTRKRSDPPLNSVEII